MLACGPRLISFPFCEEIVVGLDIMERYRDFFPVLVYMVSFLALCSVHGWPFAQRAAPGGRRSRRFLDLGAPLVVKERAVLLKPPAISSRLDHREEIHEAEPRKPFDELKEPTVIKRLPGLAVCA